MSDAISSSAEATSVPSERYEWKGLRVSQMPVVLDVDGQLEKLIEESLNGDEQFRGGPVANRVTDRRGMTTIGYGTAGEVWPGAGAHQARPRIRLNQLYWPTTMSRYGEMWVLMRGDTVKNLTLDAWGLHPPFTDDTLNGFGMSHYRCQPIDVTWQYEDDPGCTAKMYVEDVKAVSRLVRERTLDDLDLVCVHLVDYRYYLQQIGFGCAPSGYPVVTGAPDPFAELPGRHQTVPRSWNELLEACYAHFNLTGTASVAAEYLEPSPDLLDRCGENVAHLMDAIADTISARWHFRLDGHLTLARMEDASYFQSHVEYTSSRQDQLSWGAVGPPAWSSLVVLYPKCINGKVLTYGERYYWQMVLHNGVTWKQVSTVTPIDPIVNTLAADTQAKTLYGIRGVSHVIHSTCLADFRDSDTVQPDNYDTLTSLTRQILARALSNHYHSRDATWTHHGALLPETAALLGHDFILIDFGVEGAPEYRLRTGGEWSEARGALPEKQSPPELVTERKRRLRTHIRSCRWNPPRINLSYDTTVPVVIEPYFMIDDAYTVHHLIPGSYAYGTWVVYNTNTSSWDTADPLLDEVKIYDPRHLACAMPGEVVHCRWSDERKRWEVDEPYGLHRKAVVKAVAGIPAGGSGACEIYHDDAATGLQVTVHLIWMDQGQSVAYDKEIYIHHDSGEQRWWMPGAECPGGTSGSSSH